MIRPARPNDAKAIACLWDALVRYHHNLDHALPKAAPDGQNRYASYIQRRLRDPDAQIYVAESVEGLLIGYVLGMILDLVPETFEPERGGFLADIYVMESYRHQGIGRALVQQLMNWFKRNGIQHVEWYVATENQSGRRFWESIGGREVMIRMRIELNEEGKND